MNEIAVQFEWANPYDRGDANDRNEAATKI